MAEAAEQTLTPTLRFPEFHGEALLAARLGDVTEENRDRNGTTHTAASVMGVTKADGIVPMEARLIAADIERYKIVERDWFAYNPMRLNIGSIAWWQGENAILVSPDYVVFKCIANDGLGILPSYFDQYRRTKAWDDFVTEGGDGGVRIRIYYSDIARHQLTLPSLAEQQKIAECLSTLDERIVTESQKLDALKAHKKGLMQQLFPREGETLPRLRFPEFQDAPEWDEAKISDRCSSFSGGTPSTSQKEFYGGTIPFIRSAEIGKKTTELFLTELGLEKSAAKKVAKGYVLVALYGANSGDVALAQIDGAINQAILCLQPEGDGPFLYQYLSLKKEWIVATYIQGGQGNLSGEIVKSITLRFPEPEEQKRIAVCLSSLDDLIAAQSDQLEVLKTHKKGLMQQLFPSPKAAEG